MKAKDRLHIAEQFLASRELSILRSQITPWQEGLTPPREYVSDMLIQGNYRTEAFSLKLNRFLEPAPELLCLVMGLTAPETGNIHFQDQPDCNEKISRIITAHGAIMAWLTPSVLTMAIPLPSDPPPVEQMASAIKKKMETTLDVTISMGAAHFPWMDFSRQEIFHHGVKALDHAGFHNPGALIFPNAITFNISGDRRYRLGLLDEALAEYRQGLLLDPGDFNLLNSLGVCNSVLKRFDQALEQFEKALEIMPKDVMALYNAGLVCNLMDNLDKGGTYLTRASELNDTIFEVELTAGILFTKASNPCKALLHLEKAGSISPRAALPQGLIGDICFKLRDYPRAVIAYTKAIKRNPRDPWSMSGLARVYEIQNINMNIALSLAQQSIALAPAISLFRHRLGKIYLKKGWYEKAAMEFTQGDKHLNFQKGVA
jgi:tetratricopeptide (TPR) repeat protein